MPFHTRYRADQVDPTAFIAPGAVVLGDVTIGSESSVWYASVIRGDTETIRIGQRTNIQDGCVIHTDPGILCEIGNDVTIGHGAIVHGARVADGVLIGMRATLLNGVSIGPGCLIAAGALVTEGTEIPAHSVVMGAPGKIVRETTERDRMLILYAARHYVEAGAAFREDQTPT